MSTLLEVQDNGEVRLPAEVHSWQPHTQLQVANDGGRLVIEPAERENLTDESARVLYSRSPAERATAFRDLIAMLPKREGPEIADEALRRENMYD